MQNFTKTKLLRLPIAVTAVAGIAVASFLVFSTVHLNSLSRRSTDRAAASVSRLYLSELAGRREQVVEDNLQDNIRVIDVALDSDMMTEEDLSSLRNMRDYQKRMIRLFSLERFAFVDDMGTVYTSKDTVPGDQANVENYAFDWHDPAPQQISVRYLEDGQKMVVIAKDIRDKALRIEGQSLVVWAIAEGRSAAKAVDKALMGYTNL